ncbi:hypothetical protein [Microvirga roseola]|uniref:hypothetical protein n=1 Tax=Microvirga roseola TaxID=2883126 RepID=UPI001E5F516C|nr:hypothetical protein [Microvirga roseola]
MHRLLSSFRSALSRLFGRRPRTESLTAVEYEAVCLIAYEGREAYARACEQAEYCRSRGVPNGVAFWREVAAEVARRTGRAGRGKTTAFPE